MKKLLLLLITHALAGLIGFIAGVYYLPIIIAPPAPTQEQILSAGETAPYTGEFVRNLPGSDALHWGHGTLFVSNTTLAFQGELSPGPDYKVYLSPVFVDNKSDFIKHQADMIRVGEIDTFQNFIVPLPPGVQVAGYNTVVIWCEAFQRFITAGKYQ